MEIDLDSLLLGGFIGTAVTGLAAARWMKGREVNKENESAIEKNLREGKGGPLGLD